jgi:hypothetical protein
MRAFRRPSRPAFPVLGAAALAAALAGGCATPEAAEEEGVSWGFELGNEQDMIEERSSRPEDTKYE